MKISMYQASVPVCERALKNLDAILKKAEDHARANEIEPEVLIGARLYPDMFPLVRQVQIATDIAGRGATRLAGREPAAMEDNETSFADLHGRIRHTLELLSSFRAEEIDGSEDRKITFKIRGEDVTFDGRSYLLGFVMPNVYFHITTAYNILRHNGVKLGKADFLGER